MNKIEYQKKIMKKIFNFALDKKIIVYGTGKNASFLIDSLKDCKIIGMLDAHKVEGTVDNIPIITWDDIGCNDVDILIIAARDDVQREIFHRIKHYAYIKNFKIYNMYGHEFTDVRYPSDYEYKEICGLNKTYEELIEQIQLHKYISFDLYDTLIMRKYLEPSDIFDFVAARVKKKGIFIENYKKNRQTAELEANGEDIYTIYSILSSKLGLSEEEKNIVIQEEIACEKECIIVRQRMLDAYNYAKQHGKIVSIISNMYMPKDIIVDILNSVGIINYDFLYISCDKGYYKSDGLFQMYINDNEINAEECLHIGDNDYEDGIFAKKLGINTFLIKSSINMLRMSKLSKIMNMADGVKNRFLIGNIISELFNDPFILSNNSGYIPISSMDIFIKGFIAPIAISYIDSLVKYIEQTNSTIDGVIFPSRDGYLFKKLYFWYLENMVGDLPKAFYLITSRKISSITSIYNESDMHDIETRLDDKGELENFWINIMGFKSLDIDDIVYEAEKKRENYVRYMKSVGISIYGKYLFCDLISRGTTQIALKRIFKSEFKGYYMCDLPESYELGDDVTAMCNETQKNNISWYTDFLEFFFTAPYPSADSITQDGKITYKRENRTIADLDLLKRNQKIIQETFEKFFCDSNCIINESINVDLIEMLVGMIGYVIPLEDVALFFNSSNIDSVSKLDFNIMRRIYH